MSRPLPPSVCALLDMPLVGHISTISPSGRPQASIVWFERRDAEIVVYSLATSPKVRNLRQNPHVELLVVDPEHELAAGTPYYVRLTGDAEVRAPEPDIEHRMARRYGHPNGYPPELGKLRPPELVNIHISVRRVSGLGPFDGLWEESAQDASAPQDAPFRSREGQTA